MSQARATIGCDVGRILQALGGLLLVSLVVPILWGEYYALPALVVSALVPLALGQLLYGRYRDADAPGRGRVRAYEHTLYRSSP